MRNVEVFLGDVYLTCSLAEFVQTLRQRAILVATREAGSLTAGVGMLRWPLAKCKGLMHEQLSERGTGPLVASIPLADISRLSFFRFGKSVERIAVDAVSHLGSNYRLRHFFSVREEDVIRRIKASPEAEFWVNEWRVPFALD